MVPAADNVEDGIEEDSQALTLIGALLSMKSLNTPVLEDEKKLRSFVHRCIFAFENIKKGAPLTEKNMVVLRPGNCEYGIEPKFYDMLIEKKVHVNKDIASNSPIMWNDVLNFS